MTRVAPAGLLGPFGRLGRNRRPSSNVITDSVNGNMMTGAIATGPALAVGPVWIGSDGRIECPLPPFVGVGPGNVGTGVMHGMMIDGSGVGGPPPGLHSCTAVHTSVGANLPPHDRPNGTRKPSKKYDVGVRFGPPRTPGPFAARLAHPWVYFCHAGKRGSTRLKSRNSLLTFGPVQPSAHRRPVA